MDLQDLKTNNHTMTAQELQTLLTERAEKFHIKNEAFHTLQKILSEDPEELIGGFARHEITFVFEGYQYLIEQQYREPIIRARISLCVQNEIYLNNLEPIGYYDLEMDFDGEIVDDWFVVEKEKYLKDIGIISYFQGMNKKMPSHYLKGNHGEYEFVSYISLVGTLFISKDFEGAGVFVDKANTYLKDYSLPDKDYLKECRYFLKIMSRYLIENNLVSEELKQKLEDYKINK
ncbi:hypothetical protein [Chryseobacterium gleum]|uniref:hypothetical protein n=2 Tax=Chryseobacterium gleum TaxID=250 RepID=UPI0028ACCD89|nr:hypothetical protein [Chryseobacterium gleum]